MADANETNYGPLAGLIGIWTGDKGLDVAPEPDGSAEESPYYERLVFEAAGTTENAEEQVLAVVRYQQTVRRKSNKVVFHSQVGYWMWDAATGVIMQSLTIPRGLCVLAGGEHDGNVSGVVSLRVRARLGQADWGILQSPFMSEKARTVAYGHGLTIDGDQLSYEETTSLEIYGNSFEHTDHNVLMRK